MVTKPVRPPKPVRKNVSEENAVLAQMIATKPSKEQEIEIEKIHPCPFHDRKYIDKISIVELSESIVANGLLTPIIVRKLKDGTLQRIVGYRRIEAYKLLNKKTIAAVVLEDVSDVDAILMMMTENMQRVDLSVYDETLSLIEYISVALKLPEKETIQILNRFKNFSSGVVELTQEEKKRYSSVEELLAKTGKITIGTLINRLSMLNVNEILKKALSKGSISYSNAKSLNKIKDENALVKAIEIVTANGYSKRETDAYVKELLATPKKKELTPLKKVSQIKYNKLTKEKKELVDSLLKKILEIVEK